MSWNRPNIQRQRFLPGNGLKQSNDSVQVFQGNDFGSGQSASGKKFPIIYDSYNQRKEKAKYQPFGQMSNYRGAERDQAIYQQQDQGQAYTFQQISEPGTANFIQVPQSNRQIDVNGNQQRLVPTYEQTRYVVQPHQQRTSINLPSQKPKSPSYHQHQPQHLTIPFPPAQQRVLVRPHSPINSQNKVVFLSPQSNGSTPTNSNIFTPQETIVISSPGKSRVMIPHAQVVHSPHVIHPPQPVHLAPHIVQQPQVLMHSQVGPQLIHVPQNDYNNHTSQHYIHQVRSVQQQNITLKSKYEQLLVSQKASWQQNKSLRQQNKRLRDLVHHLQLRQKQLLEQKAQRSRMWQQKIQTTRQNCIQEVALLMQRYRLQLQKSGH